MGLFSSVLHVRATARDKVLLVMDSVLRDARFSRADTMPIPPEGVMAIPNHNKSISSGPYYLVSPQKGDWLTIIEAHFAVNGAPNLADLGNRISAVLACYTLALIAHDDDLLLYNLDHEGEALDGYNSYPQYFERTRLSDEQVEEQRPQSRALFKACPVAASA
jgi:hypothetical protein